VRLAQERAQVEATAEKERRAAAAAAAEKAEEARSGAQAAAVEAARFAVGAQVHANWNLDGVWYPAAVETMEGVEVGEAAEAEFGPTFVVSYGAVQRGWLRRRLRLCASAPSRRRHRRLRRPRRPRRRPRRRAGRRAAGRRRPAPSAACAARAGACGWRWAAVGCCCTAACAEAFYGAPVMVAEGEGFDCEASAAGADAVVLPTINSGGAPEPFPSPARMQLPGVRGAVVITPVCRRPFHEDTLYREQKEQDDDGEDEQQEEPQQLFHGYGGALEGAEEGKVEEEAGAPTTTTRGGRGRGRGAVGGSRRRRRAGGGGGGAGRGRGGAGGAGGGR
jgi:hypothetical protein